MLKKNKNIVFLVFTIFALISCNSAAQKSKDQKSGINSVSYHRTAGRGGSLLITASKDSLIFEAYGRLFKGQPKIRKKMNDEDWQKITASINMKTIEQIESGESRGHYDGPDEIFEIKTSEKEYRLVNVQDSTKAKQLQDLKKLLENLIRAK